MLPAARRIVDTPHTSIESVKLFAFACGGPQVHKRAASIFLFGRVLDHNSRSVAEMDSSA